MNLEEKELRYHAFEIRIKNTYDIKGHNGMTYIHGNEVNKIPEYNLLHDILNHYKGAKCLKIHYFPILHECMNTQKGEEKFKNFRILLDIECSSTIVLGRLIKTKNLLLKTNFNSLAHASR